SARNCRRGRVAGSRHHAADCEKKKPQQQQSTSCAAGGRQRVICCASRTAHYTVTHVKRVVAADVCGAGDGIAHYFYRGGAAAPTWRPVSIGVDRGHPCAAVIRGGAVSAVW